jgi:hypothetical protein
MTVIPFPRERSRRAIDRPVEPPAALGGSVEGARALREEFAEFEDRRRMQQNMAACLVVVVLIVSGAWVLERLRVYSHTLTCLEFGHYPCAVLDPRHLPAR